MAIQPIISGNVANSVSQTKSVGRSTIDSKNQAPNSVAGDDTVSLSNGITQAVGKDSSTPIVDENRVANIKAALQSGDYRINAEQTASKLIDIDKRLLSNTT